MRWSIYVYKSQTVLLGFSHHFLFVCFETLSFIEPRAHQPGYTDQQAPNILLSLPIQHWDCMRMLICPPFYMAAGSLTSVLHAFFASTLQIKPLPQSYIISTGRSAGPVPEGSSTRTGYPSSFTSQLTASLSRVTQNYFCS